jgi:hypothetical protein
MKLKFCFFFNFLGMTRMDLIKGVGGDEKKKTFIFFVDPVLIL